mmetsp:Transcript_113454/g.316941  ORF Transcript_113454/g.316941 Transcript_113454/m.316941 type:complete len:354 (-) Transcript_113454:139-1200(-)
MPRAGGASAPTSSVTKPVACRPRTDLVAPMPAAVGLQASNSSAPSEKRTLDGSCVLSATSMSANPVGTRSLSDLAGPELAALAASTTEWPSAKWMFFESCFAPPRLASSNSSASRSHANGVAILSLHDRDGSMPSGSSGSAASSAPAKRIFLVARASSCVTSESTYGVGIRPRQLRSPACDASSPPSTTSSAPDHRTPGRGAASASSGSRASPCTKGVKMRPRGVRIGVSGATGTSQTTSASSERTKTRRLPPGSSSAWSASKLKGVAVLARTGRSVASAGTCTSWTPTWSEATTCRALLSTGSASRHAKGVAMRLRLWRSGVLMGTTYSSTSALSSRAHTFGLAGLAGMGST